jgi:hypothetical protein
MKSVKSVIWHLQPRVSASPYAHARVLLQNFVGDYLRLIFNQDTPKIERGKKTEIEREKKKKRITDFTDFTDFTDLGAGRFSLIPCGLDAIP